MLDTERPFVAPQTQLSLEARAAKRQRKERNADSGAAVAASRAEAPAAAASTTTAAPAAASGEVAAKSGPPVAGPEPPAETAQGLPAVGRPLKRTAQAVTLGNVVATYGSKQSYCQQVQGSGRKLIVAISHTQSSNHQVLMSELMHMLEGSEMTKEEVQAARNTLLQRPSASTSQVPGTR